VQNKQLFDWVILLVVALPTCTTTRSGNPALIKDSYW